jgi:hypothetical protein
MNHTSGPADVEAALSWFASASQPQTSVPVALRSYDDASADVSGGWGDTGVFNRETVRRIPLFAGLEDAALEVVVKSAREQRANAGDAIITRWEGTRHFYTVLNGEGRGPQRHADPPNARARGLFRRARGARLGGRLWLRANRARRRRDALAPSRAPLLWTPRTAQTRPRDRPPPPGHRSPAPDKNLT